MEQSALNFIYFLAAIGAIYFILFLIKILWSLLKLIIPAKNLKDCYGQGSWAVVTGASDGIGLGFCMELAEAGINIVLIARNRTKCQGAQEKLRELNQSVETRIIIADFTECQREHFFEEIENQLRELDISMLINNVGMSNMNYLHEIPIQRLYNQINVNVVPMVMLSNLIIPKMLKRQQRSAIVNISSFAGTHPTPYVSTYSATKAFNDYFSKATGLEYDDKIDILSVQPMLVESNMTNGAKGVMVATARQCANASLSSLGLEYETNGWWKHRLNAYVLGRMPTFLLRFLLKNSARQMMQNQSRSS